MKNDLIQALQEEKYMPRFDPIPDKLKVPPVRIDHYGPSTYIYVRGVQIGRGVKSVEFTHKVGEHAKLILECDADELCFSIPVEKTPAPDTVSSEADQNIQNRSIYSD